jgi:hypothetical protein
MTKIIKFPEKNNGEAGSSASLQETINQIEEVRKLFCDEVSSDVFEAALAIIGNYGLTMKSDMSYIKSAVFLEEAIKSYVYKLKNIHHPMHDIVDKTITVSDELEKEIEEKLDESLKKH